jgi:predicted NBD/HSP70 family sugar kinase
MTAVLAADIGGTKILAALVEGGRITARRMVATPRDAGPEQWTAALAEAAQEWRGHYRGVGIAVTGVVTDGHWSALNARTLDIPKDYPLARRMHDLMGRHAVLANDAQAAAWGEYTRGAGSGRDMAFLTVSTGIGGGLVLGGRLVRGNRGLAGSFGQLSDGGDRAEDTASGQWIAAEAARLGHNVDAPAVFSAAAEGEGWAVALLDLSAARVASLCRNVIFAADPEVIVLGGGVGLAPGYLERVQRALDQIAPGYGGALLPAALGPDAGVIGMADLVMEHDNRQEETK